MPTRTKSVRHPAPFKAHRVPVGLQLIVRALAAEGADNGGLFDQVVKADISALKILTHPLAELDDDAVSSQVDAIAKANGAEASARRIIEAMHEDATHDPQAWLADHAVCWENAGLYLGLCLGYRVAAAMGGRAVE